MSPPVGGPLRGPERPATYRDVRQRAGCWVRAPLRLPLVGTWHQVLSCLGRLVLLQSYRPDNNSQFTPGAVEREPVLV